MEGVAIAPEEMQARFGIEPYELASYRDITRIYSKGEVIIKEGDQEHALYMLRVGKVEVLKGAGASRESMSTIEAVNFFWGDGNDQ